MVRSPPALPIFVLSCVPGATDTVHWEDICHGQKGKHFIFITYESARAPSRWTYAENKRPFIVYSRLWTKLGSSATLSGALKIANRFANPTH